MMIDARVTRAQRQQFASVTKDVPPEILAHFRQHFNNDQPDEFYVGLLSGLTTAVTLYNSGLCSYLPGILAFVSDRCEQAERII